MPWSELDTSASVADRFAAQVARRPDHAAIADGDRIVTYAELGALAAGYADALAARAAPGSRVALLLDHGDELAAAALAALGCRMSILTLNPGDPPARTAVVGEELDPELVITTAPHLEHARAAGFAEGQIVDLTSTRPAPAGQLFGGHPGDPDDTAVFISTSGSTGRPKLVTQSHRNVLHNVLRYTNGLEIEADDRIALLAALSGGQGLATTWTALLNGATLCPFPVAERGVTGLAAWLAENEVTVFDTIPSVLRNLVRVSGGEHLHGIRLVRLASEAAGRSDFDSFRAHFSSTCRLASVLASSECGIIAQAIFDGRSDPDDGPLPVGFPAEGVEVVLAGADGAPVADGDIGEIVVRSRYLSPGYWRDDALTAERFDSVGGVRQFRSGDLARRNSAGMLEIVGRADRQVKVRGYRLQLEEVERAIAAQPGVSDAAVVLTPAERGGGKLTAFFTTSRGRTVSPAGLRRSLRVLLPAHAVPAALVELDALPLTAHGKLDRARIDELERPHVDAERSDAPGTETEELLAGLWADSLGLEHVPADGAFLDLGGDSLDAAVIAAAVDELFGVRLDLPVFADNPTVRGIAALVDSLRATPVDDEDLPLRVVARPGPLSFSQERFWRQEATADSPTHWNVTVPFSVRGPLDVRVLEASIDHLVRRHEILRTTYVERRGEIVAVVNDPEPTELIVDDLTGVDDPDSWVEEIVELERRLPFELARGPLLRWRLLRLGDDDHRLLRTTHHIVHDATSWTIFFEELGLVYEALREGKPSPLARHPHLQFIDYAAWERASVRPDSRGHLEEVAWWRQALDHPPEPTPLPFARSDPDEGADRNLDVVRWGLPPEHSSALDTIARTVGATYYMTRLAAFAAVLALETEADDFVIGTPISTRVRPELHRMFGPFINYRPLRLHVDGRSSFPDLLAGVRRVVLDTTAHSTITWEGLMRELRSRGVALPRVSASFASWSSVEHVQIAGLEIEPLPRPCGEARGFRVGVNRRYEANRCWADFDPRLFDPAEVQRFVGRLQRSIAAICERPTSPLHDLYGRVAETSSPTEAR